MGMTCCGSTKDRTRSTQNKAHLAPQEQEISFPSYSSPNDKLFSALETTYNYFKHITFADYTILLINFTIETATLSDQQLILPKSINKKEPFYSTTFDYDLFQSFIEHKLLKRPELYELAKNEESICLFKDFCLEMYKALQVKVLQYFGDKNPNLMIKAYVFGFGLLYCTSTNIEKVKFLFDLFVNENKMFIQCQELDEFLFALFILPSYAMLATRRKLGGGSSNGKISEMEVEDVKKVLDTSEFKDAKYLVTVFNNEFFNGKKELTYEEYKEKFTRGKDGFGWIFSAKGIRDALIKNNV
jgi:hypothetical protein